MEFDDRNLIFFALSLNIAFLVIHNYIVYENIENFDSLSNEAVQNIASILNTKTLTVDNLIVTNQITSSIINSKQLNVDSIDMDPYQIRIMANKENKGRFTILSKDDKNALFGIYYPNGPIFAEKGTYILPNGFGKLLGSDIFNK